MCVTVYWENGEDPCIGIFREDEHKIKCLIWSLGDCEFIFVIHENVYEELCYRNLDVQHFKLMV